jgi:ABC-type uncharacterized transport system substrate-binding protein
LTEGKEFTLKVFNAQDDIPILNNIAGSVAADKWDLIFSLSTPTTQLLSKKVVNSPFVFSIVGDPLHSGLSETNEKHH